MGAGHSHGHGPDRSASRRRLRIAAILAGTYMVAEVIGGIITGSLALLADAGHMLSDVGALVASLLAIRIAQRPASDRRTYGYHRAEILVALGNGITLVAISLVIFVEAWKRLTDPPEVLGGTMLAIATGGLLVNLAAVAILSKSRDESLNVRGAWLHVLTDALGSVQAIAAGAVIWAFGWSWADPVASILIGLLVLYSSWSLLAETVNVLMEGAPGHIDVGEVERTLLDAEGVDGVHDLHVWTITSGFVALSAHVVAPEPAPPGLVRRLEEQLHDRFGIEHTTLQVETERAHPRIACRDCRA